MLARRSSGEVSAGFLASYAGGYAIWLAYELSTGDIPLIVVDIVGLLCAGLTLAVALSLRGSLIRPATWNSRNMTSISQDPQPHTCSPTPPWPEERDGQHQCGIRRGSGGDRPGRGRAGGQCPWSGEALRQPRGGRGYRGRYRHGAGTDRACSRARRGRGDSAGHRVRPPAAVRRRRTTQGK